MSSYPSRMKKDADLVLLALDLFVHDWSCDNMVMYTVSTGVIRTRVLLRSAKAFDLYLEYNPIW